MTIHTFTGRPIYIEVDAETGRTEVTFDFLQTRSADEGTTVFCTCACVKRWRM